MMLLQMACKGINPCKTIVEIAYAGDPITTPYVTAAKKIPNVQVVATAVGQYNPATIAQIFPDLLTAHPDTNAFLALADSDALAVVPAVKKAGLLGKIKLIGNGGSWAGQRAIKAGILYSTSPAYPQTAGADAGKMAIELANHETPNPVAINSARIKQPFLVDQSNVDQFQPEWPLNRGNG
jgi:ABC-type sugar transport system substrate-binding protein